MKKFFSQWLWDETPWQLVRQNISRTMFHPGVELMHKQERSWIALSLSLLPSPNANINTWIGFPAPPLPCECLLFPSLGSGLGRQEGEEAPFSLVSQLYSRAQLAREVRVLWVVVWSLINWYFASLLPSVLWVLSPLTRFRVGRDDNMMGLPMALMVKSRTGLWGPSTCVFVCSVTSVVSDSWWRYGLCSPPGSSVHGILQARILEWVAMASSRGSSRLRDQTPISSVSFIASRFFTTEPLGKPMRIQYSGFKKAKGSEVTSGL